MPPCRFFVQGLCKKGIFCKFAHDGASAAESHTRIDEPASRNNRSNAGPPRVAQKSTEVCKYFLLGSCKRGDDCWYQHPQQPHPVLNPDRDSALRQETAAQATTDSRSSIPCKFLSFPGGCQKDSCPYLHRPSVDGVDEITERFGAAEINEEDQEQVDDFSQDFAGASVQFNDFGHVLKISLPTDFSLARITGLAPRVSRETISGILRDLGFDIGAECIRILGETTSETSATVKVEDPSFAKRLSAQAQTENATLKITPIAVNAQRTNCRKVFVSWHKPTRSVWLNFGNGDIATRVSQRFNEGGYRCLGQSIRASAARRSSSGGEHPFRGHNPLAWTVVLNDIPGNATSHDVDRAIVLPYQKPRHIEMGRASYNSSTETVGGKVQSLLEEHGPLENFYLPPTSGSGKRVKASALFEDEADAKSACALNDRPLTVLGKGKLTVTLLYTAKVKVSNTVYRAWKCSIEEHSKTWRDLRLSFHVYAGGVCATLKVEGENAKDVANAGKTLKTISTGVVLLDGNDAIWHPSLGTNGSAYQKLKSIEQELQVAVQRIRSKRQLLYYGPPDKLPLAILKITEMLSAEASSSFKVELKPDQFTWMIRGGYSSIESELGKAVAVLDIVAKTLAITGTQRQYETALAMMDGRHVIDIQPPTDRISKPPEACPICFCEAENGVLTSCKHTYCLECFEDYCKSTAATSKEQFRIKCQGDAGACSTVFALRELKEHLSSSVLEAVLESSFQEYVQRHPGVFHYCPTPDCGFIYRCTPSGSKSSAHSCPNCLEYVCTSCHVAHGEYTCAEYKDIASGGLEALERLKKELNIKDCPKCTTPMEKTEGCNHMTCQGCKAHICWVCMAVFDTSGPCYDHMMRKHGGIGLGLERYM